MILFRWISALYCKLSMLVAWFAGLTVTNAHYNILKACHAAEFWLVRCHNYQGELRSPQWSNKIFS